MSMDPSMRGFNKGNVLMDEIFDGVDCVFH